MNEKVRDFLREVRFATVATINSDGTPHQTVLWYELRGDELVLNTARGRVKDRNLLRDPRLSLCVEDAYRYVTVHGVATIVDDQTTAQEDIRRLAVRYHGAEKGERMSRESFQNQERVSLRLKIDDLEAYGF